MAFRKCLTNARIFTETGVIECGWLHIESGRIADFGEGEAPQQLAEIQQDCAGLLLLPGLIDLHIHGAQGQEMMDGTPAALREIARHCARHGVTSFLPTTWSASDEAILSALDNLARVMREGSGSARILGAHIEGPYLNRHYAGAQSSPYIRPIDLAQAQRWLDTDVVQLLSLAPELPDALSLIHLCVEQGVATSAAHSAASYEQMTEASRTGLRQVTHTFNAMPPLHHREPGLLGAALTMPDLRCEIIADGIHVHPSVVRLLHSLKGNANTLLISDSVRATGMPNGWEYEQDGRVVRCQDGSARMSDGTLAGSTLTMERALRNLQRFTDKPLSELWQTASLTPARAIGCDRELGSITRGKTADLLLLSADGQVQETLVAGESVYRADDG